MPLTPLFNFGAFIIIPVEWEPNKSFNIFFTNGKGYFFNPGRQNTTINSDYYFKIVSEPVYGLRPFPGVIT